MVVALVTASHDQFAIFVQCGVLENGFIVHMQFIDILRDELPFGVIPGPLADPVAGAFTTFAVGFGAQISTPGTVAGTSPFRQLLAIRISACQATQVTAFAGVAAGDEKTHRMVL